MTVLQVNTHFEMGKFQTIYNANLFVGHKAKNPFVYKPFNIKEIEWQIDGQSYPDTRYNMDWNTGDVLTPYYDLLSGINAALDNVSPCITLSDFKDHAAIFCLDLSPGIVKIKLIF